MDMPPDSPQEPSTKLFLGGLPPGVTNEDLREHFETFGKVDEAVVKQPPGNGSSHFGFLWVRPAEAARRIVSQDHTLRCASGLDVTIPAPVLARNTRAGTERSAARPSPSGALLPYPAWHLDAHLFTWSTHSAALAPQNYTVVVHAAPP